MRAGEFMASRIVEADVHGIDLTQALGRAQDLTGIELASAKAALRACGARRGLAVCR